MGCGTGRLERRRAAGPFVSALSTTAAAAIGKGAVAGASTGALDTADLPSLLPQACLRACGGEAAGCAASCADAGAPDTTLCCVAGEAAVVFAIATGGMAAAVRLETVRVSVVGKAAALVLWRTLLLAVVAGLDKMALASERFASTLATRERNSSSRSSILVEKKERNILLDETWFQWGAEEICH